MQQQHKAIAVMQPYIFPYIGYFQLIQAVDVFVFYDDVNFIKRGWINRNKILINNSEKLITFPCVKVSQNKLINEVGVDTRSKQFIKTKNTIYHAYCKAPYFDQVFPFINEILIDKYDSIASLAIKSITAVLDYLSIDKILYKSSESFSSSKGLKKEERLQAIVKKLNAKYYVNAIGGIELYSKEDFKKNEINLKFLSPTLKEYDQKNNKFVSGLSIIDLLMFNKPSEIKRLMQDFQLQ
ncbi:WbqC family protein [Psychroflexus sp. ALD_RP9]|uniref:WbqC family protein n=1 Tax=Psychroflexus sp. ALD_RP9 TaxID=2777186 RepID=UPI001A8CF4BA|nr:WbqC family protein [Psychroflexus sp. ALD_RP9]QSS96386.1 WbqC family protein [Psychroflexus sp. ALD_RP9]